MSDYGSHLEAFKAYDVRGRIPDELNAQLAELIGWAYARLIHPRKWPSVTTSA